MSTGKILLSDPGQLLAAIPQLVAAYPRNSVIAIGLDDERIVRQPVIWTNLYHGCYSELAAMVMEPVIKTGATHVAVVIIDNHVGHNRRCDALLPLIYGLHLKAARAGVHLLGPVWCSGVYARAPWFTTDDQGTVPETWSNGGDMQDERNGHHLVTPGTPSRPPATGLVGAVLLGFTAAFPELALPLWTQASRSPLAARDKDAAAMLALAAYLSGDRLLTILGIARARSIAPNHLITFVVHRALHSGADRDRVRARLMYVSVRMTLRHRVGSRCASVLNRYDEHRGSS